MRILKWVLSAVLLFVIVIGYNTAMFSPEKINLEPLLNDGVLDQNAVVSRLSQSIGFATVSHMESSDNNISEFTNFHIFLEESFPKIHETLSLEKVNELSLLYRWAGSDSSLKPMLLMAHQDVVPVDPETEDQWLHDPFGGIVEDGVIYGRGTVDIKSGVIGSMEAVENLIAQGYQPKRDLYLAFGHDEEVGGRQGAAKIAQLFRERGLDFHLILDEGGSIVRDGIIPGMDRPVALIGIAEKGYVSLKLTVNAVGGHSSMPPPHSALGEIAQAIVDIENNPLPANMTYSKTLFRTIGPAMSGAQKVVFANMWITEPLVEKILSGAKTTNATIRTTTAVTMASGSPKDNVLPSEATAVVNFRILPGESGTSVMEYIKAVIDNDNMSIEMLNGFSGEPSEVSKSDNESFAQVKNAIHRVTQDENLIVAPYLVTGGTDAKHFTGLSDSIYRFAFNRFTPETLERMHGLNEQISVTDYMDEVKFFRELIVGANQ